MLCTCTQNHLKMPVNDSCVPYNFTKNWGIALGGCFHIKVPKNYLAESFSADTFKEARTIDILPFYPSL